MNKNTYRECFIDNFMSITEQKGIGANNPLRDWGLIPAESPTGDIDKSWAEIAHLSAERWSKDNPFDKKKGKK